MKKPKRTSSKRTGPNKPSRKFLKALATISAGAMLPNLGRFDTVRGFDTQQKIFLEITAGTAVLDDPETAADEAERLLALSRSTSRPVNLEIYQSSYIASRQVCERSETC